MSELETDWTERQLGEVCRLRAGSGFKTEMQGRSGGDFPFIKQSDMSLPRNWRFIVEATNWVDASDLATLKARPHPKGTVVFGKIGEGLKRNRFRVLTMPTIIDNNMMGATPTTDVDADFFAYLIGQIDMGGLSEGSALPYLRTEDLARVPVMVPPLEEQRAIARMVGALDDKIDSNRRLVATVLELLPYEVALTESAAWQQVSVSSLGEFVNGGAYTKDATGTGRMVIRIAELNSGPSASTVYNDIDVPDEKIARPGDVLMAWSGSLGVHYWTRPEAVINQHIFKVVCSDYPAWFVFLRLQDAMPEFRQTAADKATTMGHIKRHHLDDVTVLVPPGEVLRELDCRLEPLWSRLLAAEAETLALVAMRDAVLPELLSGRLRVSEVGLLLEELA